MKRGEPELALATAENLEMLTKRVARAVTLALIRDVQGGYIIPVGISARHVHLTENDVEVLFGKGHRLEPIRQLSQPGMFAAKETVIIVGPTGVLQNVRVLGPCRSKTQVEISKTDGFMLGIDAPVRDSGDHEGTPGCILVGPNGAVKLENGVIVAMRHIHMPPETADKLGLKNKDLVKVRTSGERKVIFDRVLIRVSPDFLPEMHVDTDEANAAGLRNGDQVIITCQG